jgi:hypothetical protein
MDHAKRVNILAIVTALLVAVVRHGVQTKWGPWDGFPISDNLMAPSWVTFLVLWLAYGIALVLLIAIAGFAIIRWHKFFVGSEFELLTNRLKLEYYVVMTVLVATLAIGFLSFGPFTDVEAP